MTTTAPTPGVSFPPSIETIRYHCEYCGHMRDCVRVQIAEPHDDWMLCAPCVRADHTDDEVRTAFRARIAQEDVVRRANAIKQADETRSAADPAPYKPEPYAYSRDHAINVLLSSWKSETIDNRQCERLCARVHAGYYDDPRRFYRDETAAQWRHAQRMHRRFGWCRDLFHKHCSDLSNHDIDATPEELQMLILTLTQTIERGGAAGTWADEAGKTWKVLSHYPERCGLLKRRYRWVTGEDWQRPGWEHAA